MKKLGLSNLQSWYDNEERKDLKNNMFDWGAFQNSFKILKYEKNEKSIFGVYF